MHSIACETLSEFWEAISPIGHIFGIEHTSFIYRGQADSSWELVPRAFRSVELSRYKQGLKSILRDHTGHFFFEWALLSGFVKFCDDNGMPLPEDSLDFRRYFDQNSITNLHGMSTEHWPEERVLPLMALAQHHGLPTRLLDWTTRSYVAAYFAAASSLELDNSTSERIAVYALNQHAIQQNDPIQQIYVPGSTSKNLSAQGGCFILIRHHGQRSQDFESNVSVESKMTPHISENLFKITLPRKFAPDLLLRCAKFGVTAGSMFPGYDGISKAVLEQSIAWDKRSI